MIHADKKGILVIAKALISLVENLIGTVTCFSITSVIPQGLKAGDKWCLCASRWQEALDAGCAPKVELEATDEKALEIIKIKDLISHAKKQDV